ncbi:MAG TPA: ROK family protein [Tepidisphaeraceae bacterium]|jgi:predicted NBD/HSP70 family sugar kinase|nr:ROK family protein [Tepidisphaeraceae bacterium]
MEAGLYIGLDIGGTKLIVAAADAHGKILEQTQSPTPLELDAGLSLLHEMIGTVSGGRPIAGMGAAIGGPLDHRTGVVSPLHQPMWRNVPLGQIMQDRWNAPLHVDVDTNVAALGEYHFGGNQVPRMLYLTVSTGMGGGFLIDGRIYRGMNGEHPEVAHQAVPFRCSHPEKIACACGTPDCLEALVSGNAIKRVYGKPAEQLTEPEWAEVQYNLAQGLRNLSAIYLPDLIVLGGGVACGRGEKLLHYLREFLPTRLKLVPVPKLALSRLGYHTALLGSIAVAIHGLELPAN